MSVGPTPADPMGDHALSEIHSLGGDMLAAARDQDWVTVANLEVARGALIRELFANPVPPPPETLGTLLRQVLDVDRQLIELGEAAHAALSGQLGDLKRGRSALSAYADSGRDE